MSRFQLNNEDAGELMTTLKSAISITRRTAIGAGIVYGLACFNSRRTIAASRFESAIQGSGADLYAFPGAQSGTTVIAVTACGGLSESETRIHAGSQEWVFDNEGSTFPAFPAFRGKVVGGSTDWAHTLDAIVIEVPNGLLAGVEQSGIWGERFSKAGSRQRIGSQYVAALMMNNDELTRKYHSVSPSQDRKVLHEDFGRAVATLVRNTPQIRDPFAYGERLALRLLPDVLHCNPELPQGFSFASQNGRHPSEDAATVVRTILNGSPSSVASTAAWNLGKVFPYFRRPFSMA